MNIMHFTLGRLSQNTSNGVNKVVSGHAKYINKLGEQVYVIGLSASQKENRMLIQRDGFEVESFNSFFMGAFKRIKELAPECAIIHLHSVWNHFNLIIAGYLRKIGKPYVITVHAGLAEDRFRQSHYWVKKYYHTFLQKKMFDKAAGIQALTREESTVLRKHTSNKNIFFIQNGQDLEGIVLEAKTYVQGDEVIKVGFVGRLSVEKNIDGLIKAISLLPNKLKSQIELRLIGAASSELPGLMELVCKLDLNNHVIFEGALYGNQKDAALQELDFYIHPAHSDVVSIAVMEAMRSGLPCVITRTSDVSYYYNSGAFIMVETTPSDIARGIIEMIEMRDVWPQMSQSAVSLVEQTFNWEVVVEQLLVEYFKCLRN